jgi:YcaO cyclodehydratase, ATP-ad Mg2+-binding
VRPKLNANTNYILMPDGIYLRSNGASFSLRGKNLDHFLEFLPSLNGYHTLEEITQGSSADKQALTIQFLETLLSAGFLKDTSQEQPHTLTQAELATYSPDIAFIDSFQTSAASRFASFRNKQLLVIGSGLSFTALVQAGLHCGVKRINMIHTPECDIIPGSQADRLDLFALNDPEQKVQAIAAPQWENETDVLNMISACDALLHISDRPMLARVQMLNRLCIEQKKLFIQAMIVGDHAWIGPLVSTETGGCWECAWRRLVSVPSSGSRKDIDSRRLPTGKGYPPNPNRSSGNALESHLATSSEQHNRSAFRDHTTASVSQFLSAPTAAMIANRLIFEVFKHCTHAGPVESVGGLIDIHLETLVCERRAFLPHPHCSTCQHPAAPTAMQFLDQLQQLQDQAPLDPTKFCENMVHDVDHRLGLFTTLDTNNFAQAPLAVYRVTLSNSMFLSTRSRFLEVIGVGTDRSSAKVRACQRACERYAASFVDPRRLLHTETIQQQASPAILVDQLVGASAPLTDIETWTWALDLHTQQACLVPAPLAFPLLQHGELGAEDERGIGSGMSWAEAICQALFDWCNFLAIEQVGNAQQRYAQVDLATVPMSPEGMHLYHLLQILGEQVTVYDVTSTLQVPTFAICVDQKVVAYSTHCDVTQALSVGLRQALQQYQATQAQEPEYALMPVPDLPEQARVGRDCRDRANLWREAHRPDRGQPRPQRRSDCKGRHEPLLPPQPLPASTNDDRWDMLEGWSAHQKYLLQRLQAQGFQAWALPLDHDPALVQVLPYIVRVLLANFSTLKRVEKGH